MRFKFWLVRVVFLGCAIFLCWKIIEIKIEFGSEYQRRALAQLLNSGVESDRVIVPNRGAIMDRNNKAFAVSSTVYNIYIDIRVLVQRDEEVQKDTLKKVNQVLGIPMEELENLLKMDETGEKPVLDTNVYYLEKKAPFQRGKELEALKPACVYLEDDTNRTYPNNNLAASVIGFTRGETSWGLEGKYNTQLSGQPGRVFRAYDQDGSITTNRLEAEEGYMLVTTLDMKMQQDAERLTEQYGKLYESPNASMIVMDPNTCEILAMAQYPNFNLNDPMDLSAINDQELAQQWLNLSQDEQLQQLYKIWANFNVSSTFESGSIFKPVTVAAALEEGIISYDSTYYCPGVREVAGWDIHCHKVEGHGQQTLDEALANSCNVAMMIIAEKMGREMFYKYQTDFGYGEKTGIDLPGEEEGIIFPVSGLNASELATSSFGQRFNCTPIQAITSFAAVINGGNLMKPYVVAQMVDSKGNIVMENKPAVTRKAISRETSDYLRKTMEKVVSPSGTGWKAVIDGYAIGGKTGTGEQGIKGDDETHSLSFIAYLPVENPQYLVMALVNRVPKHVYDKGDATAAFMLQDMLNEIIKDKGIQPSYDIAKPSAAADDSVYVVEDYLGKPINEVINRLNSKGIAYDLIGNAGSTVSGQIYAPGTRIMKKTAVIVLTIASEDGTELIPVPNVIGLEISDAEKALTAAGFEVIVSIDEAAPPPESGGEETPAPLPAVYEQTPEAGVQLPPGTQIRIKGT